MRLTLAATAAALALTGIAFSATPSLAFEDPPAAEVAVTRDGDRWTVDYVLPADAPVWAFRRSALDRVGRTPWRPTQWSVETPGVVLERHGDLDVLRATDGGPVPRRLRIAMTPRAVDLEADYDPALIFTDGSVALFSGHFDVFPLASVAEAEALPLDLDEVEIDSPEARMTWRDRAGPVLLQGQRRIDPTSQDGGLYVLFGDARLVDSPRLATVIDPQLPAWISAEIGDFAPRVADHYGRRLGPGQTAKPTVMISWNGPTAELRSMGGSVLPGLIVMAFEGEGVVEPSPQVRDSARWFIGHESAHFWLGQTVRYEAARDAWITEGGADLMAIRALAALDPAYDARAELQREVDGCIALADEPVSDANARGEHRAYYACGAVFALAAEAAQTRATGGDGFDFLKAVIDANRADGVVTRDEWLAAFDAVAHDPILGADIERLLDQGDPDAAATVADLLQRAGVPVTRREGRILLD
jgi:hypothetical protein